MAGKSGEYGKVVKDYIERFPNTPSLTLAKKIFKENQPLFNNVEHARELVRYYSGKAGEPSRHHAKPQIEMPETFAEPQSVTPYILPKASKRILVLSDIHCPYHDREAIELAVKFGIENQTDTVVYVINLLLNC